MEGRRWHSSEVKEIMLTSGKPDLSMPTPCEDEDLGYSTERLWGEQVVDLLTDQ